MDAYRITVKIVAESKAKATREIGFRVPNGKICTVRKDNNKKNAKQDKDNGNG